MKESSLVIAAVDCNRVAARCLEVVNYLFDSGSCDIPWINKHAFLKAAVHRVPLASSLYRCLRSLP